MVHAVSTSAAVASAVSSGLRGRRRWSGMATALYSVTSESSIVSMGMTLCPAAFARCAGLMVQDFNWNTKFHHRALTHWKKARNAAMLGHNLRHNRKTQSRATRRTASRRIGPHESLEEPFALFHVDAFAIITNVHDGEGLFIVGSKLQFARGITRRIVN